MTTTKKCLYIAAVILILVAVAILIFSHDNKPSALIPAFAGLLCAVFSKFKIAI